MSLNFRTLRADEIELRVGQCKKDGCSLLLYQDSRCGMNILDEEVGTMDWCREHNFKDGKLYCKIGIWDEYKKMFVYKEDVGVESNTEAEKGQASDSFKRACVNWGIGRELYSAPFTWIKLEASEVSERNGKYQLNPAVKFSVKTIEYDSKKNISKLVIVDSKGTERFSFGQASKPKPKPVEKPTETIVDVDPMPYIETPQITPLTKEELTIISSNSDLTSAMKDCLQGVKYKELSDEGLLVVAKTMRFKMKEMGV